MYVYQDQQLIPDWSRGKITTYGPCHALFMLPSTMHVGHYHLNIVLLHSCILCQQYLMFSYNFRFNYFHIRAITKQIKLNSIYMWGHKLRSSQNHCKINGVVQKGCWCVNFMLAMKHHAKKFCYHHALVVIWLVMYFG